MASKATNTEGFPIEESTTIDEIKNAIAKNDLESLTRLLNNKTSEFCGEALYFAVVKKGIDALDEITKNASDTTQLEEATKAIRDENKRFVKFFLDLGADVNVVITNGPNCYYRYTLFGYVCRYSDVDIVSVMMEHGADLELKVQDGLTPIEHGFASGNEDKINFFLKLANAENINKWNLLHHYVNYNEKPEENVMARLLQIGADINKLNEEGYTVLNCSFKRNNVKCLKFLINQGADVNGINNFICPGHLERENYTELSFAVRHENIKIVRILLENGADPNLGDPTPLIEASWGEGDDSLEVIDLLLNYGADINKRSELEGLTPLAIAASRSQVKIVKSLLDRGALKDNDALIKAVDYGYAEVVAVLLNQGFNPNINTSGGSRTLLMESVLRGNIEVTKLLLDHGARVNEVAGKWKYALHCAVNFGYKEIVALLLDYGADINLDDTGRTAVTISISRGHNDLCKYLVKRMILMKAQGFNVSKVNLNATKAKKELENFQNECDREMGLLTSKVFDDSNLFYFDILMIKDVCKIASLANNENIVKVIKSEEFLEQFAIYGPMIVEHFDKGISENKDFQLLIRFIGYLSSRNHDQLPKLPFIAIAEIFNHLNAEDVAKLRQL